MYLCKVHQALVLIALCACANFAESDNFFPGENFQGPGLNPSPRSCSLKTNTLTGTPAAPKLGFYTFYCIQTFSSLSSFFPHFFPLLSLLLAFLFPSSFFSFPSFPSSFSLLNLSFFFVLALPPIYATNLFPIPTKLLSSYIAV